MTFTLDEKTFTIEGFRGDSASFTFDINTDISNYTLGFYVKKNINDTDEKAIISKEFQNPKESSINLVLSNEDTKKLTTKNCCFQDYYWGLKLKTNDGYTHTLIPKSFDCQPIVRIYP